MAYESYDSFGAVKQRLDEIVEAVGDEGLALDDALALYEEAVGLGLRASDLLEEDIEAQSAEALEEADASSGVGSAKDGADGPAGEAGSACDAGAPASA